MQCNQAALDDHGFIEILEKETPSTVGIGLSRIKFVAYVSKFKTIYKNHRGNIMRRNSRMCNGLECKTLVTGHSTTNVLMIPRVMI